MWAAQFPAMVLRGLRIEWLELSYPVLDNAALCGTLLCLMGIKPWN